jgi:hypothetical protein
MSDNTTNIHDLPSEPPTAHGNVKMTINEPVSGMPNSAPQLSLNQETINQIVNGLQQASLSGATSLPSRDIPMNTDSITNDPRTQPNYVPPPEMRDYINHYNNDMQRYEHTERTQHSLDALYDELQTPLLLAVLYFLFQLPFFKKTIFKYLPFFCNMDGNYNFNGLMFTCGLFGFIYYSLSKTMNNFNKF